MIYYFNEVQIVHQTYIAYISKLVPIKSIELNEMKQVLQIS
jgi:hypothetical protein